MGLQDLPFRGLGGWLRSRLPPSRGDGALYAVLLAYDAGRNLERIPEHAVEDPPLPAAVVARYPAWLEADGPDGPWRLRGTTASAARRLRDWIDEAPAAPAAEPALPERLTSRMSPAAHRAAVEHVLDGIRAGDLYQANVARRLEARMDPAATPALYRRLRARSPAAFGTLWAAGDATWLASVSPECLLHWDPHRREAHSYPIKGTRPRGEDAPHDRALAEELREDAKERAEHVMIVDLVRNDLGRVAEPGGVRVDELFGLQTLPTVHHLVSDVAATLPDGVDLPALVEALFPGGSITGAPKISAMAHIERAEGLRRGFYTGSFGLVEPDGRTTLDILIRSAVAADGRLLYQTGGGIVADSDPGREWDETVVKAAAIERALAGR